MFYKYKSVYKNMLTETEAPASGAANAPEGSMSSAQYVQDVKDDPKKAAFTPAKKDKKSKAHKGTTSEDQGHKHSYEIDEDGNGETSYVNDHFHKIVNFKVKKEDGHVHLLDK